MNKRTVVNPPRSPLKIVIILSVLLFAFTCLQAPPASALNMPEKLVFDLTWTGIKAGTATQEIAEEKDSVRVTSIARSADWISVFFKVEDKVESRLAKAPAPQLGVPKNFRMKTREGGRRKDRELIFDHVKGHAVYIDHLNGHKIEVPIKGNTYDPYSSFYYVRTLPLEVGKSVYVSIVDMNELWNVEVQVLKKEKLKTIFGEVNTILIKPLIKSEGIFERKGEIYIWLTDDTRRIPVKMKTKVMIGSITATLVGGDFPSRSPVDHTK